MGCRQRSEDYSEEQLTRSTLRQKMPLGRIPPLLQGLSLASRSVTHSIGTPMTHGIQAS